VLTRYVDHLINERLGGRQVAGVSNAVYGGLDPLRVDLQMLGLLECLLCDVRRVVAHRCDRGEALEADAVPASERLQGGDLAGLEGPGLLLEVADRAVADGLRALGGAAEAGP